MGDGWEIGVRGDPPEWVNAAVVPKREAVFCCQYRLDFVY